MIYLFNKKKEKKITFVFKNKRERYIVSIYIQKEGEETSTEREKKIFLLIKKQKFYLK